MDVSFKIFLSKISSRRKQREQIGTKRVDKASEIKEASELFISFSGSYNNGYPSEKQITRRIHPLYAQQMVEGVFLSLRE